MGGWGWGCQWVRVCELVRCSGLMGCACVLCSAACMHECFVSVCPPFLPFLPLSLLLSPSHVVFAMFGMLSPASRGALMTAAIVLFMFMGLIAGYNGARMYRTLKGTHWKRAAILTATLYPGVVFGVGFVLNFFIWGKHSSGAVSQWKRHALRQRYGM